MCISVLIKIEIISLMEMVCLSMYASPGKIWWLLSFNLFYSYSIDIFLFLFFCFAHNRISFYIPSKTEQIIIRNLHVEMLSPQTIWKQIPQYELRLELKNNNSWSIVSYPWSFLNIGTKKTPLWRRWVVKR